MGCAADNDAAPDETMHSTNALDKNDCEEPKTIKALPAARASRMWSCVEYDRVCWIRGVRFNHPFPKTLKLW